jgi:S-adenosylmethionine decarboxylase
LNALGTHILLELHDCDPALLDDLEHLRGSLMQAAIEVGATIIDDIFHQFSPHGVTGVIAIAESHLCIHTWPEYCYAAVDVFTCGENFKPHKAIKQIVKSVGSRNHKVTEIERGLLPALIQSSIR